ncbi:Serine/threonine protein kinase [Scheffersomyces xylosifermentans]|uniref:Serine/threonine protein kinase n=1 Tax=Scheffersomyces xylosifermentans TaxID=1304137 RepID=UPI00315CF47B
MAEVSQSLPATIENYELVQCIGKGNFGDVYKSINLTTSKVVAIKVVNLDDSTDEVKMFTQEIQFLSRLRNRHITNYYESFVHDYNMFIVMEYCGGGSCADLLRHYKKFPEDLVAYIIRDVLKGLNYLHSENKVHRDIKSANILLTDNGEIKLADFGVSGEITMTRLKRNTFVGTPFWMAPEVITRGKSSSDGGYNEKADIWSAGITTIELVTGSPPLSQYDPMKIIFEIPKKRPPILVGINYSDNIKDFVKYCLIKDPKARPRAKDLLHHQFISRVNHHGDTVQNMLIRLISDRNTASEIRGKFRKPRHKLINTVNFSKKGENEIKWDFNSVRDGPIDRITVGATSKGKSKANSNVRPSPQLPESSPLNSALLPSSPETVPSPQESASSNVSRKGEVLFYCIEQVYHRSKTESAKRTVETLLSSLLEFENEQPGLCEAIVEELCHLI